MASEPELQQQLTAVEEGVDTSADGTPGWQLTLYVMWIAQLIAMIAFSFVMPFLPFYLRELGVRGDAQVAFWSGVTVSVTGLAMMVAAPIWGSVADRHGRRPMVLRAMFGGAAVMALMGLATSLGQIIVLRLVQGFVTGTVTAATALVSSVTPRSRMGFSMGLIQTSIFSGFAIGPLLGGIAADRFGYRAAFFITGALLFTAGLLVVFGTREHFRRPGPGKQPGRSAMGDVLRTPGFTTMLVVALLLNLSGSVAGPLFPLLVEKIAVARQDVASVTGMMLAISGLVASVSAVGSGRLCDRIGRKQVLVACTGTAGLFCLPQAFVHNLGELFGLRAFLGLSSGGSGPAVNALVGTLVPRERYGGAFGLMCSMSCLGGALGPLVGGTIAAHSDVRVPFVITGAMLILVAGVAFMRVREPHSERPEPRGEARQQQANHVP
ncbi:MAG: multidrug efflux MFS transporter [candidate division WS1 bacterium]|nr:multidrug efflux MFS transporter [candidate division WS1 bacterium]